ncbi:MAG: hypothetical protein K6G27_14675 [Lachnospiraceae bacterium]|nr:hypothetical protein [Lachnospiraceae bacterium]
MKKLLSIVLALLISISLAFATPAPVNAKTGSVKKSYNTHSQKSNTKKKAYKKNSKSTKKNSSVRSGSKYSTKKKSYSKSKKKEKEAEWPDCDDYWDEDEFLDDWDGNMPDDSDAMDYWDNW